MALASYAVALLAWIAFLPAAIRGPSGPRGWARIAVVLGLVAIGWEIWITFGPGGGGAPIRLDIPLLVAALCVVYVLTAARLWAADWRRSAIAGGALALLAGAGFGVAWARIGAESAALRRDRASANRMLFEAKFRNEAAYRSFFGMDGSASGSPGAAGPGPPAAGEGPRRADTASIDGSRAGSRDPADPDGGGLPVGHWEPVEPGSAPLTRLIINPAGRVVRFFGCGDTECQFGPGARLEARPQEEGGGWRAVLVNRGVGRSRLTLVRTGPDALDAQLDAGAAIRLERTPPPLRGEPAGTGLAELGGFASIEQAGQHARVAQLWLWRDGAELLGVGIFRYLVPGRRAEFVQPIVLGRGVPDGDGYRFAWSDPVRGEERARAVVTDSGVVWEFEDGARDWPRLLLEPGRIFRDEVMELAPLEGAAAWQRWFDLQLQGHFSSAEIPDIE